MFEPLYTPQEAQDRRAFLALLWAASQPGCWQSLPSTAPSFIALGQALLDLETSFYAADEALARQLARTGARALPPERADYLFFPVLRDEHLEALSQAQRGTLLYPDSAATIFIGLSDPHDEGVELRLTLQGPGVNGLLQIALRGIPFGLWTLRAQARYPLGWDIYFVEPERGQVLGLPRSTQVRLSEAHSQEE
ncbi:MAG: phosphonate C-P lyase system protein PhnH [Anaerolineae bacterium]|nr:phosphonate C-P lyase system protein PhnH [Anaerolineae bacterium]MDW8172758.1 phosphonate C-P lyase system protein PhnH [Anaerolineae bacterium]